jgi:hypothetical protein
VPTRLKDCVIVCRPYVKPGVTITFCNLKNQRLNPVLNNVMTLIYMHFKLVIKNYRNFKHYQTQLKTILVTVETSLVKYVKTITLCRQTKGGPANVKVYLEIFSMLCATSSDEQSFMYPCFFSDMFKGVRRKINEYNITLQLTGYDTRLHDYLGFAILINKFITFSPIKRNSLQNVHLYWRAANLLLWYVRIPSKIVKTIRRSILCTIKNNSMIRTRWDNKKQLSTHFYLAKLDALSMLDNYIAKALVERSLKIRTFLQYYEFKIKCIGAVIKLKTYLSAKLCNYRYDGSTRI